MSVSEPERKRVKLACQACKRRKVRCNGSISGCELCLSLAARCIYLETGTRRGPPKGYKARLKEHSNNDTMAITYDYHDLTSPQSSLQQDNHRQASQQPTSEENVSPNLSNRSPLTTQWTPSLKNAELARRPSMNIPMKDQPSSDFQPGQEDAGIDAELNLDPAVRDQLLGAYFTHVHNVWPLIYKPAFHVATAPRSVLLAMLAAAAVIPVPRTHAIANVDADLLFRQAQIAIIHPEDFILKPRASGSADRQQFELQPLRPQISTVQALMLFSLRQTSRGSKSSAYMWACKAFGMALELGLHRAAPLGATRLSQADAETRSRIFWCCYTLDKALSEETGRPFILRASAATIPLPSISEADEFELWPPPLAPPMLDPSPSSNSPSDTTHRRRMPRVQPVRSRTISCFNSTCRLGYIVEQLLDIDIFSLTNHKPVPGTDMASNQVITLDAETISDEQEMVARKKIRLAKQLEEWYRTLDEELHVNVQSSVCAPTQFIVNMAWYHSATILLHSRYIAMKPDASGLTGLYGRSHQLCNNAAESIVALLACLDRFGLLAQSSSDVLHMLSHAALFHAYNSSLPDIDEASRANVNFQQCCLWLKEIGSSWAPASPHRLFFEGLMKGGKELAASNRRLRPTTARIPTAPTSPSQEYSPDTASISTSIPLSCERGSKEQDADVGGSMDLAIHDVAPQPTQGLNPFSTDMMFRARSNFWNEWVPNADLFVSAPSTTSTDPWLNANMHNQIGKVHPMTGQLGGGIGSGTQLDLESGFDDGQMMGVDPLQGYLGSLDPSDMLVAYMLESAQQT